MASATAADSKKRKPTSISWPPPLGQVPHLGADVNATKTSPEGRITRWISSKARRSSPGSRWMIELERGDCPELTVSCRQLDEQDPVQHRQRTPGRRARYRGGGRNPPPVPD